MTLPKGYVAPSKVHPTQQLLKQAEQVASQRVDDKDYDGQIQRWNEYHVLCYEIRERVKEHVGADFNYNIKSNMRTWRRPDVVDRHKWHVGIPALVAMLVVGFTGLLLDFHAKGADGNIIPHAPELVAQIQILQMAFLFITVVAIVVLSKQALVDFYLSNKPTPKVLHAKMSPTINIDEARVVADKVIGIDDPKPRDPVIYMPAIEIHVPLKHFGMQKLHEVMGEMSDLNLPEEYR